MDEDIRLDKGDVTVQQVDEECGDCTASIKLLFFIVVDFRSAGMTQHFGPYCEPCAEKMAERIRDGLPEPVLASESSGEAKR